MSASATDVVFQFGGGFFRVDEKMSQRPHGEPKLRSHVEACLGAQVAASRQQKHIMDIERDTVGEEGEEGRGRESRKHKPRARMNEGQQRQHDLLLEDHRRNTAGPDRLKFGAFECDFFELLDRDALDAGYVPSDMCEVEKDSGRW